MKLIIGIISALVLLIVTVITSLPFSSTGLAFAQGAPKYMINLTGNEEVPPVQTNGTGVVELSAFDIASNTISHNITVTNITGVTAGHTHFSKQGENGPVVVTFFKYGSPRDEVKETGKITADRLEGPMKGKPLSDLAQAANNGSLYINIHTDQNPNGEIRGQIKNPTK